METIFSLFEIFFQEMYYHFLSFLNTDTVQFNSLCPIDPL